MMTKPMNMMIAQKHTFQEVTFSSWLRVVVVWMFLVHKTKLRCFYLTCCGNLISDSQSAFILFRNIVPLRIRFYFNFFNITLFYFPYCILWFTVSHTHFLSRACHSARFSNSLFKCYHLFIDDLISIFDGEDSSFVVDPDSMFPEDIIYGSSLNRPVSRTGRRPANNEGFVTDFIIEFRFVVENHPSILLVKVLNA